MIRVHFLARNPLLATTSTQASYQSIPQFSPQRYKKGGI
jgi:hypothetical protein